MADQLVPVSIPRPTVSDFVFCPESFGKQNPLSAVKIVPDLDVDHFIAANHAALKSFPKGVSRPLHITGSTMRARLSSGLTQGFLAGSKEGAAVADFCLIPIDAIFGRGRASKKELKFMEEGVVGFVLKGAAGVTEGVAAAGGMFAGCMVGLVVTVCGIPYHIYRLSKGKPTNIDKPIVVGMLVGSQLVGGLVRHTVGNVAGAIVGLSRLPSVIAKYVVAGIGGVMGAMGGVHQAYER